MTSSTFRAGASHPNGCPPVTDTVHGQDLRVQPREGVCPVWGPQDCVAAFANNVVPVVPSDRDLQHHLEIRGRGSLPENCGMLPSV